MAAQHRTPAYCPHGDRLSRLHRGCDCESAVAIRRPRARGASRGSQNLFGGAATRPQRCFRRTCFALLFCAALALD